MELFNQISKFILYCSLFCSIVIAVIALFHLVQLLKEIKNRQGIIQHIILQLTSMQEKLNYLKQRPKSKVLQYLPMFLIVHHLWNDYRRPKKSFPRFVGSVARAYNQRKR